jgi:hypothetical protein
MLKDAVSSLGRWVGLAHDTGATQAQEDERRVWIRYPSSAEAICQPANADEPASIIAKVQDISRGGINLRVNRWFEPGTLLSIQLPDPSVDNASTVLAYVVRSNPKADGEWSLGCTFATELGADDLQPLGVPRVRPEAPDQRSWERFPSELRASYQVVKTGSPSPKEAAVLDLSPMGIGLLADEELEVGTLLNLELRNTENQGNMVILASVVRVTARGGRPTILGCNFIRELSHKELKALL